MSTSYHIELRRCNCISSHRSAPCTHVIPIVYHETTARLPHDVLVSARYVHAPEYVQSISLIYELPGSMLEENQETSALKCCLENIFHTRQKRTEGSVLCKLRSRLLVTTAGSLRFDCQHPAPRSIRSRGHPLRVTSSNETVERSRVTISRVSTF